MCVNGFDTKVRYKREGTALIRNRATAQFSVRDFLGGVRVPTFSIGVTTYNRKELLSECLTSIIEQTFQDFEIIIGNDYQPEPLTLESIGIVDPRILIINHSTNLGELENLNSLLNAARGRYFTWQADDDYYAPTFLEEVYNALGKWPDATCVYTSYGVARSNNLSFRPIRDSAIAATPRRLSGRCFLRGYLSGRIITMGTTGVYERTYLQTIGGARKLADTPIAVMSEYLLLVQSGLVKSVAYIERPLVYYRAHEGSWSTSTTEVERFRSASLTFFRESLKVLQEPCIRVDFAKNLSGILRLIVQGLIKLGARRGGRPQIIADLTFARGLRRALLSVDRGLSRKAVICFYLGVLRYFCLFPMAAFISTAPSGLRQLAIRIRGRLVGEYVEGRK